MAIIKGTKPLYGALSPSRVIPFLVGSPAAAADNYVVTQTDMKVGAYTLAHTTLDAARNVTVTHTATSTVDTLGTVAVVGTDIYGNEITETITPSNGTTVQGVKAFKTITSVTGAGWEVADGADKIKVGTGEKLGLPVCLSRDTVLNAYLNGVREGTRPTVAVDAADLSKNTVDLDSACNGSPVIIDYYES